MPSTTPSKDISDLLEQGYVIADNSKLYGLRKKIPKSNESTFKQDDDNFEHFIRYSLNKGVYEGWIKRVTLTFDKAGLQTSKLQIKINDFDPSIESNLPAQKFMRTIRELQKIVSDSRYLNSYARSNDLSPVELRGSTLSQGINSHTFQSTYAIAIRLLWDGRQVQNQRGEVTKKAHPTTHSMFEQKTGVKRTQLANFAKAIRNIERKKGIHIQLKYPRGSNSVFLVVHEN